ncbi:hypothetical protein TcasGA2_TC014916 [Tribolium castaneum]|uniref:Uncharacterized protein n=1 Tax=Tribolium castaneum TaxID=7070 RepID=A0A139WGH5_TRICA|nr:hypothetical protein TcasGA2_TC014916 [Tribolium castaneum]
MAPKLRHPFIDGLRNVPENRKKELNKIKICEETMKQLQQVSKKFYFTLVQGCFFASIVVLRWLRKVNELGKIKNWCQHKGKGVQEESNPVLMTLHMFQILLRFV